MYIGMQHHHVIEIHAIEHVVCDIEDEIYPAYLSFVGRSHGDSYSLFSLDTFASPGVRQYAQTGGTAILDQEPQGAKGILDVFTGPRIPQGTGEDRTTFFVDNKHSEVTLLLVL